MDFHYDYDDNGNLIEEKRYSALGNLVGSTNFQYDSRGNLILEKSIGDDTSTMTLQYNSKNLLIQAELTSPLMNMYATYTYDADGQLIMLELDAGFEGDLPDGIADRITVTEYNSDGTISIVETDNDPSEPGIDWQEQYRYDDNGRISSVYTGNASTITGLREYEYGQNGLLIM